MTIDEQPRELPGISVPDDLPLHLVSQVVGDYGRIEVVNKHLVVVPADLISSHWIFTTLAVLGRTSDE